MKRSKYSEKERKAIEEAVFDLVYLDCDSDDFENTQMKPFMDKHKNVDIFARFDFDFRDDAALVQFMVKLYFLSQGVTEYASLFPDKWDYSIDFASEFRITLHGGLTLLTSGAATYEETSIETDYRDEDENTCIVTTGDWGSPVPSFDNKMLTAAQLFCALANLNATTEYWYDEHDDGVGYKIESSDTTTPFSVIVDMLMSGKLFPCGHCGKPVRKTRANKMPFCKKSHQTRYNEKAKHFVIGGASYEQTVKAFPHIAPETIDEWYKCPELLKA